MLKRIARFVKEWNIYLTPFKRAEINDVMKEPGGMYIMAFCQHCCKRVRHKLWLKKGSERYAYCLLCGRSWRYTGRRLSGLKDLD